MSGALPDATLTGRVCIARLDASPTPGKGSVSRDTQSSMDPTGLRRLLARGLDVAIDDRPAVHVTR